jgi:hypothetical protein
MVNDSESGTSAAYLPRLGSLGSRSAEVDSKEYDPAIVCVGLNTLLRAGSTVVTVPVKLKVMRPACAGEARSANGSHKGTTRVGRRTSCQGQTLVDDHDFLVLTCACRMGVVEREMNARVSERIPAQHQPRIADVREQEREAPRQHVNGEFLVPRRDCREEMQIATMCLASGRHRARVPK